MNSPGLQRRPSDNTDLAVSASSRNSGDDGAAPDSREGSLVERSPRPSPPLTAAAHTTEANSVANSYAHDTRNKASPTQAGDEDVVTFSVLDAVESRRYTFSVRTADLSRLKVRRIKQAIVRMASGHDNTASTSSSPLKGRSGAEATGKSPVTEVFSRTLRASPDSSPESDSLPDASSSSATLESSARLTLETFDLFLGSKTLAEDSIAAAGDLGSSGRSVLILHRHPSRSAPATKTETSSSTPTAAAAPAPSAGTALPDLASVDAASGSGSLSASNVGSAVRTRRSLNRSSSSTTMTAVPPGAADASTRTGSLTSTTEPANAGLAATTRSSTGGEGEDDGQKQLKVILASTFPAASVSVSSLSSSSLRATSNSTLQELRQRRASLGAAGATTAVVVKSRAPMRSAATPIVKSRRGPKGGDGRGDTPGTPADLIEEGDRGERKTLKSAPSPSLNQSPSTSFVVQPSSASRDAERPLRPPAPPVGSDSTPKREQTQPRTESSIHLDSNSVSPMRVIGGSNSNDDDDVGEADVASAEQAQQHALKAATAAPASGSGGVKGVFHRMAQALKLTSAPATTEVAPERGSGSPRPLPPSNLSKEQTEQQQQPASSVKASSPPAAAAAAAARGDAVEEGSDSGVAMMRPLLRSPRDQTLPPMDSSSLSGSPPVVADTLTNSATAFSPTGQATINSDSVADALGGIKANELSLSSSTATSSSSGGRSDENVRPARHTAAPLSSHSPQFLPPVKDAARQSSDTDLVEQIRAAAALKSANSSVTTRSSSPSSSSASDSGDERFEEDGEERSGEGSASDEDVMDTAGRDLVQQYAAFAGMGDLLSQGAAFLDSEDDGDAQGSASRNDGGKKRRKKKKGGKRRKSAGNTNASSAAGSPLESPKLSSGRRGKWKATGDRSPTTSSTTANGSSDAASASRRGVSATKQRQSASPSLVKAGDSGRTATAASLQQTSSASYYSSAVPRKAPTPLVGTRRKTSSSAAAIPRGNESGGRRRGSVPPRTSTSPHAMGSDYGGGGGGAALFSSLEEADPVTQAELHTTLANLYEDVQTLHAQQQKDASRIKALQAALERSQREVAALREAQVQDQKQVDAYVAEVHEELTATLEQSASSSSRSSSKEAKATPSEKAEEGDEKKEPRRRTQTAAVVGTPLSTSELRALLRQAGFAFHCRQLRTENRALERLWQQTLRRQQSLAAWAENVKGRIRVLVRVRPALPHLAEYRVAFAAQHQLVDENGDPINAVDASSVMASDARPISMLRGSGSVSRALGGATAGGAGGGRIGGGVGVFTRSGSSAVGSLVPLPASGATGGEANSTSMMGSGSGLASHTVVPGYLLQVDTNTHQVTLFTPTTVGGLKSTKYNFYRVFASPTAPSPLAKEKPQPQREKGAGAAGGEEPRRPSRTRGGKQAESAADSSAPPPTTTTANAGLPEEGAVDSSKQPAPSSSSSAPPPPPPPTASAPLFANSQEDVFTEIAPLVQQVLDGTNACVVAYGQSASGKTYSLFGKEEDAAAAGGGKGSGVPRADGAVEAARGGEDGVNGDDETATGSNVYEETALPPEAGLLQRSLQLLFKELHRTALAEEALLFTLAQQQAQESQSGSFAGATSLSNMANNVYAHAFGKQGGASGLPPAGAASSFAEVQCSMMEIYHDKIRDLLAPQQEVPIVREFLVGSHTPSARLAAPTPGGERATTSTAATGASGGGNTSGGGAAVAGSTNAMRAGSPDHGAAGGPDREDWRMRPDVIGVRLLCPQCELRVRASGEADIAGLTYHTVATVQEAMRMLRLGLGRRETQPNAVHGRAARSHVIFTVHVTQTVRRPQPLSVIRRRLKRSNSVAPELASGGVAAANASVLHRMVNGVEQRETREYPQTASVVTTTRSKLTFVDLAGVERVSQALGSSERLRETQYVNKSLSALGDVAAALSASSSVAATSAAAAATSSATSANAPPASTAAPSSTFMPYRSSKLTGVLQDTLNSGSLCVVLACIAVRDDIMLLQSGAASAAAGASGKAASSASTVAGHGSVNAPSPTFGSSAARPRANAASTPMIGSNTVNTPAGPSPGLAVASWQLLLQQYSGNERGAACSSPMGGRRGSRSAGANTSSNAVSRQSSTPAGGGGGPAGSSPSSSAVRTDVITCMSPSETYSTITFAQRVKCIHNAGEAAEVVLAQIKRNAAEAETANLESPNAGADEP